MKREVSVLLLLVVPAIACGQTPPLTFEYYPLEVGQRWTYRAIDLKSAQPKTDPKRHVIVEVERTAIFEEKKLDKDNAEKVVKLTGFLLKSTTPGGGKTTRDHVVVKPDGVYRIHAAETPITPPLLFFKAPKKLGEKWESNSVSGNATIKGTFTAERASVKVPLGTFDALLISYRSESKTPAEQIAIDSWFAKDIGMVKQRVRAKNHEVVLELERVEKGK